MQMNIHNINIATNKYNVLDKLAVNPKDDLGRQLNQTLLITQIRRNIQQTTQEINYQFQNIMLNKKQPQVTYRLKVKCLITLKITHQHFSNDYHLTLYTSLTSSINCTKATHRICRDKIVINNK